MHSLPVDFARDCFAIVQSIGSRIYISDQLLLLASSVRWIVSSIFGRAPSPAHLAVRLRHQTKKRKLKEIDNRITSYRRACVHLLWTTSWRWRRRRHYGMNVTHHVPVLQEIEAEILVLLAGATAIAPPKREGSERPVQWRLAPAAAPAAAMEEPASPPSAPRGVPPFLGLSAGLWPSSPSAAVRCPRRWPRLSFLVSRPRPWDRLACLDGRLQ